MGIIASQKGVEAPQTPCQTPTCSRRESSSQSQSTCHRTRQCQSSSKSPCSPCLACQCASSRCSSCQSQSPSQSQSERSQGQGHTRLGEDDQKNCPSNL